MGRERGRGKKGRRMMGLKGLGGGMVLFGLEFKGM